ncbi:MAG: ThuA domain-containing protein [Cyclobacteriaceae bacterium]
MKKYFIGAILIMLVMGYYVFFGGSEESFMRVLVFSKTEAFRHDSIEKGQVTIKSIGEKNGYEVVVTEDAEMFKEKVLKDFNVIVFLNTTGDVLNDAQQLEMNRFIQAGGGYVGIHAAADTEYDWPWYNELVGAWFESHPSDPNVQEGSIDKVDKENETVSHLPERWTITDEFYSYKDIQPDIKVLLNLDESTYEGGTNGENHPITWYKEFDGGRSWYTGLGHEPAVFDLEEYVAMLEKGIDYAAGAKTRVNYDNANVAPDESRFTKEVFLDNLNEPMELEMLPNGNLIFVQRHGEVILYDVNSKEKKTIQEVEVFSELEDGLLGITIDPEVASNRYIYLFYSHPVDTMQVISRFTMSEDFSSIDMQSEVQLLTVKTQRNECCHAAGSIEFGNDRQLFIATGDNTSPRATGYNPIDERPGRSPWDAQKSSGNANDLRGKILRISVALDGTVSIPDGNLFPKDGSQGRPEIYVMGCRNPYRISIDKRTGDLYWGDVGPDAGEDSTTRGPKGHDEVNKAVAAGNFGWPYFIGDNKAYNKFDFETEVSGEKFDPAKPVNNSPNNTGVNTLPPAQPAFIWYGYDGSDEFPLLGDGGRTAMAGPVYYKDDYPETEKRFPDYFDGKLFIYEWMRGWMIAVTMDEAGNYARMERFMPGTKFNNPTDIIMGPDGDMYMLEYGTAWFRQNEDARLVRIKYIAGNRKPVAKIQTGSPYGKTPFNVEFSSAGSKDFDGDDLTYSWSIAGSEVSTEPDFAYTFENAGEFDVSLKVADPDGETDETSLVIKAGNAMPVVKWEFTGNQSFYWDNSSIDYKVVVTDEEDGSLGNGIDPADVEIAIDYLERGMDMNEVIMGHEAMASFSLGQSLIEGSDCMACHQMNSKSVGPSYVEIAAKYKDQDKRDYLADKIIKGGSGVWGDLAMAAHPQMTMEEAGYIVDYILSQSGTPKSNVPGSGTYTFEKHIGKGIEGTYILSASYTDKGGNEIGPLASGDVVMLKSPWVLAATASALEKTQKFDLEAGAAPGVEQDMTLLIGAHGGWAKFDAIDFTRVNSMMLGIAQFPNYFKGGEIELRIDGPTGEVVGSVDVVQGLTDMGEKKITLELSDVSGVHDLYYVFDGIDQGPVCALVYMVFNPDQIKM